MNFQKNIGFVGVWGEDQGDQIFIYLKRISNNKQTITALSPLRPDTLNEAIPTSAERTDFCPPTADLPPLVYERRSRKIKQKALTAGAPRCATGHFVVHRPTEILV